MTAIDLEMSNKQINSDLFAKTKRGRSHLAVLKVFCKSTIVKPLNGAVKSSKGSYMLKLAPIQYTYLNKQKKVEVAFTNSYHLKGLRGALRHRAMAICRDNGIEICHTSEKREDKNKNPLIPIGFHPLGECAKKGNPCIIYEIFGGLSKPSKIAVAANPLVSRNVEKSATFAESVQLVHLSTERRNTMGFKGTPIQDFSEGYFSGSFNFEVDVTQCTLTQLGLLITVAYTLERLGRGYSAGYGRLNVDAIQLLSRELLKSLVVQEKGYRVKEEVIDTPLLREVEEALAAWDKYVGAGR